MESVHLYFLFYQTSLNEPLRINLPRTLIKGYGFQRWTLMYSQRGILRFKLIGVERLLSEFFSKKYFPLSIVKTSKSQEKVKSKNLEELLPDLLSMHSEIIIQEYLTHKRSHKILTVKWSSSNYIVSQLKDREDSIESDSFISLGGWRPEITRIISLVRHILERYFSTYMFRMIQLSFAMDTQGKWRIIQIDSYKVNQRIPNINESMSATSRSTSKKNLSFSTPRNIPQPLAYKRGRIKQLATNKSTEIHSPVSTVNKQRAEDNLEELNHLVKIMQDVVDEHCERESPVLAHTFRRFINGSKTQKNSSRLNDSKNSFAEAPNRSRIRMIKRLRSKKSWLIRK